MLQDHYEAGSQRCRSQAYLDRLRLFDEKGVPNRCVVVEDRASKQVCI